MLVKNKYLLDDYMQDRAKNNAGVTFLPESSTANFMPRNSTISAQNANQSTTVTAPVRQRPRNYVAVEVKDDVVQESASEGLSEDVVVTKSDLTTADVRSKMDNVLQELLDFSNRKFVYNAKESPLYTILQQQAEKEARLASGRAYSRATANAGGFGSSYATLAGEEASRQVMAGLDDQQLALYEAAKAEFDSQWQTKLEQYNALSQIYNNQKVDEAETTQIMTDAINSLRERYGAEYVEEAMRADLSAMGLTEEQIGQALANQKQYSDAIGAYTNQTQSGVTDEVLAATQYLQSKYGSDYSEAAMRAELQAAGYNEADITAALEAQRKIASGSVTDYKATNVSDAISYADLLEEALSTGVMTQEEYDAAKNKNSELIMKNVRGGMDRISDVDYEGFGISADDWSSMNDSEKKLKVLDQVGQLVKRGVVSHSEYFQMVVGEVKADVSEIEETDVGVWDKNKDFVKVAVVVQDLYDNGYIYDGAYNYIMTREILPHINKDELREMYRNNETKAMGYSNDMHRVANILLGKAGESEKAEEKKTTNKYTGKMTFAR